MKTFLRRPGNKTKHLKHIIPLIPEFSGRFIEPFLGTGAVYLNLLPKKAILNDINKDIINIWKLVRDDPDYLLNEIDKFKVIFLPLSNDAKLIMCKKILSKMDSYSSKKRTVMYLLMIYCNYKGTIECKRGFYIYSLHYSIFNSKSCHIFTKKYKEKIQKLSKILKNVKIENKCYSLVLKNAKKNDFIFLDPPYIENIRYNFKYNNDDEFNILKLKNILEDLTKKGIKWMMTQVDTEEIRSLFNGYNFSEYINKNSFLIKIKNPKKEVIISNY